jgi:transglutaminase-like putative cysteine protease
VEVKLAEPRIARRFKITHANHYEYDQPVTRSVHRLRLRPIHDIWQNLSSYKFSINVPTTTIDYEDVFGNWTTRFELTEPYTKLSLIAESQVELQDVNPFAFAESSQRPIFPVNWMPWESKMLAPYLSPVELPDTQMEEIFEYAISFVKRNNRDLLETFFDINLTFFREFSYQPASTTLETTPFEVLVSKRGVCQDFANLMICMARLLNVPARYVCGYVFTGNTGGARAHSDASHAWVQLYMPNIGWKAFDPTNGVLPSTEHVRMAVGRHYRDTAPTSGTLYSSAQETLKVDVEVAPLDTASQPGSPVANSSTD